MSYARVWDPIGRIHALLAALYVGDSSITFNRNRSLEIGGYLDLNMRAGLETGAWDILRSARQDWRLPPQSLELWNRRPATRPLAPLESW